MPAGIARHKPITVSRSIALGIIGRDMIVGERVESRMKAAGLSQAELARRVGVAQPTIFKLIRSSKKGSVHLHRIARILGTTPAYLSGETDDPDEGAPPPPELSRDETELVTLVRAFPAKDRGALLQLARTISAGLRVSADPDDDEALERQDRERAMLPSEDALTRMFEGLLEALALTSPLPDSARTLARLLPVGLAQLRDLRP